MSSSEARDGVAGIEIADGPRVAALRQLGLPSRSLTYALGHGSGTDI